MNSKLGKCYSYVEMISKKISQAQRTDGENDLGWVQLIFTNTCKNFVSKTCLRYFESDNSA